MKKDKELIRIFCTIALLLFYTAALSEAFKLPDTDQTKCYQGIEPHAEIPCTGTGQAECNSCPYFHR